MTRAERPVRGVFVNGTPDFENFYHLLGRLHARGNVDLRVFLTSVLLRLDPCIRPLVAEAGFRAIIRLNRLMKWPFRYRRAIGSFNAALGLGDPWNDRSNLCHRTRHMAEIGLPTIYLQHGVIKEDMTYPRAGRDVPVALYSGLIYLFEDLSDNAGIFAPGLFERMRVGVFFKRPCLPPKRVPPACETTLAGFRKRLLLCHYFRWQGRYTGADIDRFSDMLVDFARSHPDVAAIVRGHRGKYRRATARHDARIRSQAPNVLFSYQHMGPMKGMVMSDVVALSDVVVSTASTALLDALHGGHPIGVCRNESPKFAPLPQSGTAADLSAMLDSGFTDGMRAIVKHYGDVDANIERICDRVEEFVLGRSVR